MKKQFKAKKQIDRALTVTKTTVRTLTQPELAGVGAGTGGGWSSWSASHENIGSACNQ